MCTCFLRLRCPILKVHHTFNFGNIKCSDSIYWIWALCLNIVMRFNFAKWRIVITSPKLHIFPARQMASMMVAEIKLTILLIHPISHRHGFVIETWQRPFKIWKLLTLPLPNWDSYFTILVKEWLNKQIRLFCMSDNVDLLVRVWLKIK